MIAVIFDLDQTLVETIFLEPFRKSRNWSRVYHEIENNSIDFYNGFDEVLKHISLNKIKIAVVTSSPRPYAEKLLSKLNLQYNSLVCYHDTKNKKPYPDPILKAVEEMGINKKDFDKVLSFGDRDIDIVASKKAGVLSVACYWGAENKMTLKNSSPDIEILKPIEILNLI
jgi:HAD superfamily hydrolase (TIGR01549 family)